MLPAKEGAYADIVLSWAGAMKKIVVDIDNTLWDFAAVLYERMRVVSPGVTPPSEWSEFDFWKKYVSPRTFYTLIRGNPHGSAGLHPLSGGVLFPLIP